MLYHKKQLFMYKLNKCAKYTQLNYKTLNLVNWYTTRWFQISFSKAMNSR